MEKLKQLLKNKNHLLVIVLVGVLLLVIALPVEKKPGLNSTDMANAEIGGENGQTDGGNDYCIYMEGKLENVLSRMEGAGKVRVVISMESSEERVVEKDQPFSSSATKETDSQGGNREINSMENRESTVYTSGGSGQEPYVVKVISPKVEGVLVLAEGAGTGNVSKNISDAIQVLFGIEAHKIRVVKMETP